MPTVSVLFDIPDGYELADEKARPPKLGECYVNEGVVRTAESTLHRNAFPIVRPEWQWPAWLKAPWIAMDGDGSWYAFGTEPH